MLKIENALFPMKTGYLDFLDIYAKIDIRFVFSKFKVL